MYTPAKVARGAGRRGPSERSPGYLDLCQAPQRSEVVRGDFGPRRCGGACFTYLHTFVYQMLAAPTLDLRLQKVLLENKQQGGARQESALG